MGMPEVIQNDLKEFCVLTSLKGVPRISKARYTCTKVMWVVAVLCFLVIGLFQASDLIQDFLQYKTVTVVEDFSLAEIVGKHQKNAQDELDDSPLSSFMICNSNPMPSTTHTKNARMYSNYMKRVESVVDSVPDGDAKKQLEDYYRSPAGYYDNTPVENLTDIGINLDDFLLQCTVTVLGEHGADKIPCRDV